MLKRLIIITSLGFTPFCVAASIFDDDVREHHSAFRQATFQEKGGPPKLTGNELVSLERSLLETAEETHAANRLVRGNAVVKIEAIIEQSRLQSRGAVDDVLEELLSFPASLELSLWP